MTVSSHSNEATTSAFHDTKGCLILPFNSKRQLIDSPPCSIQKTIPHPKILPTTFDHCHPPPPHSNSTQPFQTCITTQFHQFPQPISSPAHVFKIPQPIIPSDRAQNAKGNKTQNYLVIQENQKHLQPITPTSFSNEKRKREKRRRYQNSYYKTVKPRPIMTPSI